MLTKIYPGSPAPRQIKMIVETLEKGGVVIFPTDTIYGIGCSLYQHKAFDKIVRIKGGKKEKTSFSIIVHSLSMLSEFTKPLENSVFRLIRRNLPGPFTFILNANNKVPKIFQSRKKTIGIRMPDNKILSSIVKELGHPLLTTSIHDEDEVIEYTTDPELIYEKYRDLVDVVINGGYGDNEPSTVVDCTLGGAEIVRQGKGILEE